ncbi:MAG: zinc ribbon domain-containing protein [Muribaculum sp.]|nr:zinc ribbon domain-containing protein [Muribaculum sp.]
MRCKNCGWPNRPDETTCSKCGTPLEAASSPVVPPEASTSNQTVREMDVFGGASQPNICPKCGYPLRPGLQKCPNCNCDLQGKSDAQPTSVVNQPRQIRRPTVIGVPNIHGTVNVWTDGAIGITPSFILSPVKRNGERKQPDDVELEGDNVILNRDNTDPGNLSITSRTQAVITRKDDKWFIEDKSEQKTTFVQASSPQELHEGDIILLGNRLFIFHE